MYRSQKICGAVWEMTMSDYEVQYQAAQEITRLHERAHDELASLAESMPSDIDGGADLLLSILAPIASDASSLATVQTNAANQMRGTVHRYRGIEEDAEEAFRKMAEAI